ncbi:MAG: hypothetical protein IPN03_14945 [Holophagales bacterium]|nr:hypothetical protein [Holophagales bacterium]
MKMHRFGLHGKSFLPMMTGFGCSVPGILATRTLENERDRLTTMLVLPLMSCGARLPIWMLLVLAFFRPLGGRPRLAHLRGGRRLALGLALLPAPDAPEGRGRAVRQWSFSLLHAHVPERRPQDADRARLYLSKAER